MNNNKFKIFIFMLLLLILSIVLFYSVFGFSLSYLSEEEIKETRKEKEDLISFFEINNIDTVYDEESNTYYYSIPDDYEKQKYTLKLELDDQYKYKIVNHSTNIITVNYNKTYKVLIYNDKYYYEANIKLTNLPLISITTDSEITDNDTNSTFKYINPTNLDKIVKYNNKIHIRGATTKSYKKKSYKINIYNSDYEKEKNVNISNFYYGSGFILDAMYRDNSKIRNILAIELWNSISDDFSNVDVYSEYVELFINNKYIGLYAFTEPINRRKLNLNKSSNNDTSIIVKANEWIIPSIDDDFYNIIDDTYMRYELKYPNDEELYSISWEKLLTNLSNFYVSKDNQDYEKLKKYVDINNYIDIIIFNSFINNIDNGLVKNNYYYMKNLSDKMYIQPWDLEFSFGLKYLSSEKDNFVKELNDYNDIIFDINHESSDKINSLIVNRYWNLRRSVLNTTYIDNLIDKHKEDLCKGSGERDTKLWLEYDIDKEIEEVRTWIHNRLEVYDNYIRGLENE